MNFAFSSTHKNSLLLKNNKLICLKITGEICIRNVILQTAGLNTPKITEEGRATNDEAPEFGHVFWHLASKIQSDLQRERQ